MILVKLTETIMSVCEKTSENMVGKPIKVCERTLIPVITVSCFFSRLGASGRSKVPQFIGSLVTPLAFVVVDPQGERVLPLQGKEISLSYLIDDVPGLADKIKEAREEHS